ncbi:acylphosphatase [Salinisphaera sp. T5B8]|uniref:acylphosphatase n=1 Tax=Salinisphaera sp. T5B8 TaxID=1304154 RepID=UPI00333F054F
MNNARQFLVSGRVQGVGFRAATRERANELGLGGWVHNLADGRVEVQAAGNDEALDALAHWLADGPSAAKVDHIDAQSIESSDAPTPFAIR